MKTMHNHNSLVAATLLGGLMFISASAFGQGPLLKSSGFTNPIPIPYAQVSAPVFTPPPGIYFSSAFQVTIACATSGASIRYTTDGSTPTPTYGTLYAAPVILHILPYQTVTLRAIAYGPYVNYLPSTVTSGPYIYYPPLPWPWWR